MAETLKPPEKPKAQRRDIPEVPEAKEGVWVSLTKIGPAHAEGLGTKIEGPLRSYESAPACIRKGERVYLGESGISDNEVLLPKSISHIKRIDELNDGSYLLFTMRSIYRCVISMTPPPTREVPLPQTTVIADNGRQRYLAALQKRAQDFHELLAEAE